MAILFSISCVVFTNLILVACSPFMIPMILRRSVLYAPSFDSWSVSASSLPRKITTSKISSKSNLWRDSRWGNTTCISAGAKCNNSGSINAKAQICGLGFLRILRRGKIRDIHVIVSILAFSAFTSKPKCEKMS